MRKKIRAIFTLVFFTCFGFQTHAGDFSCQIETTGGQTTVCQGKSLVLTAASINGSLPFEKHHWEGPEGFFSEKDQFYIRINTETPGNYEFSYTGWDADNFQSTCQLNISIMPLPSVNVEQKTGFFRRIFHRNPMPDLLVELQEGESVQWFREGKSIPQAVYEKYRPQKPGAYKARTTCAAGCTAFSQSILIE